MFKMTISTFIENSRVVSKNLGKYVLSPSQSADIIITKKNCAYYIVYLPLDYHIKNPSYLAHKLQLVFGQAKDGRVMVIVLNEQREGALRVGEIQGICLSKNINMMVCFDIEQVKELIDDISSL